MAKPRDILDKRKLITYLLIIVAAFTIFDLGGRSPKVSIKPVAEYQMTELENLVKENHSLQQRLTKLEPASPVKIVGTGSLPELITAQPVVTVVSEGIPVPFLAVYSDPAWVRPDYQPYWHSSTDRSLSIPDLVGNAHHRLFVTSGNKVLWDETARSIGITELAEKLKLPIDGKNPGDVVIVVTFNHQVADIFVLNNQVVLLGNPARNGLQVLALNKEDLFPANSNRPEGKNQGQYFFQLVTPDGYEIDWRQISNFFPG